MTRLVALFTLTAAICLPATARAHTDPEDVARRCVHRVDQILERCENAAAQETQDCLQAIRRYLNAGRRDLAIRTARECVNSARERTRRCTQEVRDVCTECIDWLLLHGADRLAARVRRVCADAIEQLEMMLERQENAIREALAGA